MFSCSLWVLERLSWLCGFRPQSGASDSFPERSRPKSELALYRRGDPKLCWTGRRTPSGTRAPRVSADGGSGSEFVLQHQTAPSVLRSDTTIPALGFHFPSLPHKRGHGQGQADTQWGGSLGGKCPSQQGFLLPPSDGPGSPSQLSVSLRGHLARTFSRAPKGHAAPARVNAVVSPEATAGDGGGSSGRRRAPEMPWVMGIRSNRGTWARLPGP